MTFYVPDTNFFAQGINAEAPHTTPLSGELTPHTTPLSGKLFAFSEELKNKINTLKKRASPQAVRNLIKELCASQPMKLSDLAIILERHPKYVRENYLNEMVKLQEIEHVFSDPNHPQQAYRTKQP